MTRIALDARWIFRDRSGIGVHTAALIRHLGPALRPDEEMLLLFDDDELRQRTQAETGHDFTCETLPFGLFSAANQLRLGRRLRRLGVDVYHSTNYMVPLLGRMPATVATIHDLIPLVVENHAPRSRKSLVPGLFPAVLRRAARRAAALVAVSEATRRDIVQRLRLPPDRVHVIHNGVDDHFRPGDGPRDDPPYLLYVGRFDPYKNVPRLVAAFARVANEFPRLQLRLVGSPDPRYPETQSAIAWHSLDQRVSSYGDLEADELVAMYQGATALVTASEYEGFGLPVAEAMACGVPVICGDRSSLPEVAGEAALLVDPGSEEELAEAMRRVVTDSNLRNKLIDNGLDRSKGFSWEKAASETAELYRSVAEN